MLLTTSCSVLPAEYVLQSRRLAYEGDNQFFITVSPFGPYDSYHSIHADDPSLSFFYAQHVPPPGLTRNFISLICTREKIHPSRAEIYLREVKGYESDSELPPTTPMEEDVQLVLRKGGCGSNELNPLIVHITISRQMDRTEAAKRRSVFVTGGERAVEMTGRGCCMFGSCLANCFREFPAGHCMAFRTGWIAFWTCGNPQLYSRNRSYVHHNINITFSIISMLNHKLGIHSSVVAAGLFEDRHHRESRVSYLVKWINWTYHAGPKSYK